MFYLTRNVCIDTLVMETITVKLNTEICYYQCMYFHKVFSPVTCTTEYVKHTQNVTRHSVNARESMQ